MSLLIAAYDAAVISRPLTRGRATFGHAVSRFLLVACYLA